MKIGIFNPLLTDFSCQYDINGDRQPVTYVVPAGEIFYVDQEFLANHIKKHLATEIMNNRHVKTNYVDDYNEVIKEISVDLNI